MGAADLTGAATGVPVVTGVTGVTVAIGAVVTGGFGVADTAQFCGGAVPQTADRCGATGATGCPGTVGFARVAPFTGRAVTAVGWDHVVAAAGAAVPRVRLPRAAGAVPGLEVAPNPETGEL